MMKKAILVFCAIFIITAQNVSAEKICEEKNHVHYDFFSEDYHLALNDKNFLPLSIEYTFLCKFCGQSITADSMPSKEGCKRSPKGLHKWRIIAQFNHVGL